jgi:hypothetical protein
MRVRTATACLLMLLVVPVTARAAAPANDDRANATSLDPLPAAVAGTTVGATVGTGDASQGCGTIGPTVWYSTTPSADGRVVVSLSAHGDLDVIVDVFKKVRSQLVGVGCNASDDHGDAATSFTAAKGTTYLIQVSQRPTSVAGTFDLSVTAPIQPAHPPGKPLPALGVTRTLDRIANPDDAWAVHLRIGVSYRIHLSGRNGHCDTSAQLYAPRTTSFDSGTIVTEMPCGGYRLFTPGPGQVGLYTLRVRTGNGRRKQPYHVQMAAAGPDDTAPGLVLHNRHRVRGSLRGSGVDMVDLYRFVITHRSVAFLRLSGGDFDLELLNDHGRILSRRDRTIRLQTRPGRYYVAVRANFNESGRYALSLATRLITHTHTSLTGGLGGLRATATTSPGAAGPFQITFQRFDPLAGWLFARRVNVHGSGSVSAAYHPPGPGLYRARSTFLGSRDAAASHSGYTTLEIGG